MRAVLDGVSHVWEVRGSGVRSACGKIEALASMLTIEPAGLCRACPPPEPGEVMPIRQHCKCGSSFALMRVIFDRGWLVEDESRCASCKAVLWHYRRGVVEKVGGAAHVPAIDEKPPVAQRSLFD